VGLVDAQGILVARYEYDDYGRIVHMWGADGQEVREGQGQIHYLNGDITVGEESPEGAAAADGLTATSDAILTDEAGTVATGETSTKGKGKGQDKRAADSGVAASDPTTDSTTVAATNAMEASAPLVSSATSDTDDIVKLNPYRYTGYRYDWETELYFLESRYYDSWSNRFIARDRDLGQTDQPLTLNRYIYAVNSMPNYQDPGGSRPAAIDPGYPAMREQTATALLLLMIASLIKPVSLEDSLSDATTDQNSKYVTLYHYGFAANWSGISTDGLRSTSGKVFLTDDPTMSGEAALQKLALPKTEIPDVVYSVTFPRSYLGPIVEGPMKVKVYAKWDGDNLQFLWQGGGNEYIAPVPVDRAHGYVVRLFRVLTRMSPSGYPARPQ